MKKRKKKITQNKQVQGKFRFGPSEKRKKGKYGWKYYVGNLARYAFRILVVIITVALIAVFALYTFLAAVAHGPSDTMRNYLVQSAKQASATKWVPGLFLSEDEIEKILALGAEKVSEEVDVDDPVIIVPGEETKDPDDTGDTPAPTIQDGIDFYKVSMNTFRAYIMIVDGADRVFVGVSSTNFASATRGKRIYDCAKEYGAIAAINGGEFRDSGGTGSGEAPLGLTYSKGVCVWNDSYKRTFIGFDKDNKLVVKEGMTKAEAEAMNVRDGVSFQTGNVLIETVDGSTVCYYAPNSVDKAQRTAIGQRADGSIILIVTDGRTASSLGATRDDIINLMISYGAVTAGMLDGGSSAMMYYANYVEKYSVDESTLDEYQRLGLVNKYKAFTKPRWLPTFFMVNP